MSRPYDLVLFGATGFTGQLVAEYLVRHGEGRLRWALGGRDRWKLTSVQMGLVGLDRHAAGVDLVEADASDPASLRALAASTRIVASTVGPFSSRGRELLAACVAEGTHYLDITGEPDFVAHSRHTHGEHAREAGIKVVHCCGFDSIPADLGVLYTVRQLPRGVPRRVRGYLKTRGRPSGGTWASVVEGLARGPGRGSGARTPDPEGLVTRRDPVGIHRGRDVGWALPLPVVDPMIVRATARARPDEYGPEFSYGHYLRMSKLRSALKLGVGLAGVAALARLPPTRRWLESRVPSGTGPDRRERARSFFELQLVAEAGDVRLHTRVAGGDPGYDETSKMLGECALLLAEGDPALPDTVGVLSPGAAFGPVLIDRLQAAGIVFETL